MARKNLHIIGLSGGKDSTATLLLALDRMPRGQIRPVFVDTGNEHAETYRYLDFLESHLDLPIARIKPDFAQQIAEKRRFIARDRRTGRDKHGVKLRWSNRRKREALAHLHPTGNPFLDLCLLKGMFPSNRSRFCTEYLKKDVFVSYVDDLVQSGQRVVVWQGIRRAESDKRKHARKIERVGSGFYYFRPLVDWTEADVFRFLDAKGIPPNPLYRSLGRVSCAPCIYSTKPDLRVLFASDPNLLPRLRDWEARVSACSKTGRAAFFAGKQLAGARLGEVHPLVFWDRHQIDAIQHWASKPTRFNPDDWDGFDGGGGKACSSEWGLCE
ncbi:phosphoadenosine phosphosulfate reductase family protein [Acidithiobacillus caldus]|uniref:phosphoadenosine phosphosulfate reductase domain-containing protein n=1 Tax=Acidithiobacillus caldus TaxID=33059 RepID=UPI0007D95995|nr:phosphoadenosine phosphosulfate reductase family protein [Acidithiobacillus caldus]QER45289.1 phosphoadenosine phosphosulfate reductase [Acidithiobacillus caldus]